MTETVKENRGRPTKLSTKLVEKIYFLTKKGLTDEEVCEVVDISRDTLHRWRTSKVFSDTLKECKEAVDKQVENALLNRALGFEWDEYQEGWSEKIGDWNKTVKRRVIPDVTACIFWLKNRQRDKWRDVQDHNHKGSIQFSLIQLVKMANGNGRIPDFTGTGIESN